MKGFGRRTCMALAIGVAALAMPSVASAQAVPDASCPGPPDQFAPFGGDDYSAQTFTAQTTGALTRAQILVEKAGTAGDYVVSINAVDASGTPTDTVLASTTIADASVPSGQSTLTADFGAPVEVTAGQQYALVISRPGSNTNRVGYRTTDPCPGVAFEKSPGDLFFDPDCGGTCDMVFAVFVEPPQPEPEPQPAPKADGTLTIDANKGKVEKGRKVTLSGQLDVASNESCEQNRAIQIQRRLKSEDDSKLQTFTSTQTDPAGNYSLRVKVKKTYFYRAIVGETDACDDETSNSQKVRVQKKKAAQEA